MNSLFSVFVHFTLLTCRMVVRILLRNSLSAPNGLECCIMNRSSESFYLQKICVPNELTFC